MNCRDVRKRLSEYLDDALPPGRRADLEEHVAVCLECQRELQMWRSTRQAVAELPRHRAAKGFGDRIMRLVRQEATVASQFPRVVSLWPRLAAVAAMFAVVVALMFGIEAGGLVRARGEGGERLVMVVKEEGDTRPAPEIRRSEAARFAGAVEADLDEGREERVQGDARVAKRAPIAAGLKDRYGDTAESGRLKAVGKGGVEDGGDVRLAERAGGGLVSGQDEAGEAVAAHAPVAQRVEEAIAKSMPVGREIAHEGPGLAEGARKSKALEVTGESWDGKAAASRPLGRLRDTTRPATGAGYWQSAQSLLIETDDPVAAAIQIARIAGENQVKHVAPAFTDGKQELILTIRGRADACERVRQQVDALMSRKEGGSRREATERDGGRRWSFNRQAEQTPRAFSHVRGHQVGEPQPGGPSGETTGATSEPSLAAEKRGEESLELQETRSDTREFEGRGGRPADRLDIVSDRVVMLTIRLVRRQPARPARASGAAEDAAKPDVQPEE